MLNEKSDTALYFSLILKNKKTSAAITKKLKSLARKVKNMSDPGLLDVVWANWKDLNEVLPFKPSENCSREEWLRNMVSQFLRPGSNAEAQVFALVTILRYPDVFFKPAPAKKSPPKLEQARPETKMPAATHHRVPLLFSAARIEEHRMRNQIPSSFGKSFGLFSFSKDRDALKTTVALHMTAFYLENKRDQWNQYSNKALIRLWQNEIGTIPEVKEKDSLLIYLTEAVYDWSKWHKLLSWVRKNSTAKQILAEVIWRWDLPDIGQEMKPEQIDRWAKSQNIQITNESPVGVVIFKQGVVVHLRREKSEEFFYLGPEERPDVLKFLNKSVKEPGDFGEILRSSIREANNTAQAMKVNHTAVLRANSPVNGGIDLKSFQTNDVKEGLGVVMHLNPTITAQFQNGSFTGIVGEITGIKFIPSVLPLFNRK